MCPNGSSRDLEQPGWQCLVWGFGRKPRDTWPECIRGEGSVLGWPQDVFQGQHAVLPGGLEFPQRDAACDPSYDALLTTCLEDMSYIFLTHTYCPAHFHILQFPFASSDECSPLRGANTGPVVDITFPLYPAFPATILIPSCVGRLGLGG